MDKRALMAELRELINAIDRRVPHLERDGEIDIAREAADLRDKALRRLETLSQTSEADKGMAHADRNAG